MKKLLVLTVVLFMSVQVSSADQSAYVLGGLSKGIHDTEGSFINGIVGYKKDFADKWSISAEFQATLRTDPARGNEFSFTPVFRYMFFDSEIIEPYAIAGVGVLNQDMGSTFNGDEYGHHTDTEYMFHVVAGLGAQKRFDWLSIIAEVRYTHESNGTDSDNDGWDKVNGFAGIGIHF